MTYAVKHTRTWKSMKIRGRKWQKTARKELAKINTSKEVAKTNTRKEVAKIESGKNVLGISSILEMRSLALNKQREKISKAIYLQIK